MLYFRLDYSVNNKEIGPVDTQSREALYPVDCPPEIYSRNLFLKKVHDPDTIVTPIPILQKRAKLTDLISGSAAKTVGQHIISDRLKKILESDLSAPLQFFPMPVVFKEEKIGGYWLLYMYDTDMHCIDFPNSILLNGAGDLKQVLKISNFQEYSAFMQTLSIPYRLQFRQLAIQPNCDRDVLVIRWVSGGLGLFVSETLKNKIESEGITGVRFSPDA